MRIRTEGSMSRPVKLEAGEISDIVSRACSSHPSVMAAWLFGSVAKGRTKSPNDIDVAVLLDDAAAPESFQMLSFITALEQAMDARVDVTVLNRAGEILKYEVRRHGKLIFERSSEYRKRFEIKSRKFFEDFRYLHDRYARTVLYKGGGHG